ncbi:MAG: hypothetical protein IJW82_05365 [Clostridia bacterium]|nr:hypothetical protein [Clostridia bacterium]
MYINGNLLKVKRFSSGELKFLKSTLNSFLINNSVEILYLNEESIFELQLVLSYYNNIKADINLILSYLPYQRMDHTDRDELDTVNYVADIFNSYNLKSITICEPHCDTSSFNNCINFSFINNLKERVFKQIDFNEDSDTIIVTDKGGLKRYGNLGKNVVYFNKVRDLESGLIIKHEIVGKINPNSKILIVDDIISTGDTICNIIDYLKTLNLQKTYIFCGHFEKNIYNKRLIKEKNVKKIFSTNSLTKNANKKLFLFDIKEIFYGKNNK